MDDGTPAAAAEFNIYVHDGGDDPDSPAASEVEPSFNVYVHDDGDHPDPSASAEEPIDNVYVHGDAAVAAVQEDQHSLAAAQPTPNAISDGEDETPFQTALSRTRADRRRQARFAAIPPERVASARANRVPDAHLADIRDLIRRLHARIRILVEDGEFSAVEAKRRSISLLSEIILIETQLRRDEAEQTRATWPPKLGWRGRGQPH